MAHKLLRLEFDISYRRYKSVNQYIWEGKIYRFISILWYLVLLCEYYGILIFGACY